MLLDASMQVSAAQAVTATAFSTHTIDLVHVRDIGNDLCALIQVDEAVTAAGAATVTFQVVTSANANLSSPNVLVQSDAIPKAELTAGRRPIGVPLTSAILNAIPLGQRYLGVQYTVGTGPLTAGKFSTWIADNKGPSTSAIYPGGRVVA